MRYRHRRIIPIAKNQAKLSAVVSSTGGWIPVIVHRCRRARVHEGRPVVFESVRRGGSVLSAMIATVDARWREKPLCSGVLPRTRARPASRTPLSSPLHRVQYTVARSSGEHLLALSRPSLSTAVTLGALVVDIHFFFCRFLSRLSCSTRFVAEFFQQPQQ